MTIALSGKGGVGKTFIASMLVKRLSEHGSVLAIDADPDSNLPQALGVTVKRSVGQSREDIINAPMRSPVTNAKQEYLEQAIHESIEEFPLFSIIVMGRSEGEGCYCAVNHVIRGVIDTRARGYDFTIIDCHAGLEHLSRRTTRDVDIMLVVVEPTKNSIQTATRVTEIAKELHIQFGAVLVVANRVTAENKPRLDELARDNGLEITAYVPFEPLVSQYDGMGKPVSDLPEDSPASKVIDEICRKILSYA
ncbi:MAG: AAA family ATPase [Dehalococcoidia bacterium]|nr:AAA family ATPase [Dehalococcoidia bacterium]